MRANIKLQLSEQMPVQLLALLGNVIRKMTGNALFPTPPVSLAEMETKRDELEGAIEDATNGSLAARKLRDVKVGEVRELLRMVADYQRTVCAGDAAKLATGGFPLRKQPEPINEVGVPQHLVAVATDESGDLRLRWRSARGARVYRVEQAAGDPTSGSTTWHTVGLTGRVTFDVTGLEPYAPHWFRVTAVGNLSEGLPSDVVLGRAA